MFNLSGSEIIVILLLALVVLGPEKLPDALRRAGRTYSELKKMGSTFQSEVRGALDEPVREMRETADLLRNAADFGGTRTATPSDGNGNRAQPAAVNPAAPLATERPADAVAERPIGGDDDALIDRTLSGGADPTPGGGDEQGERVPSDSGRSEPGDEAPTA